MNKPKVHPRAKAALRRQKILLIKRWCYAICFSVVLIFILAAVVSFFRPQVTVQIYVQDGFVPTENQEQTVSQDIELFPVELEGDEQTKINYIKKYLTLKGESDLDRWIKIFKNESRLDPKSVAPTQWHKCDKKVSVKLWGYQQPANDIIELRDYPNGIWQATCEEFGAKTIQSGRSAGLSHIIERTWDWLKCDGDRMNWADNIDCSIKIRNTLGWSAWTIN